MRPVPRFRRIAAALSSALLLQLSLLGSGTMCPMRGHGAAPAHAAHQGHHGMRHAIATAAPSVGASAGVPGTPAGTCDVGGSCDMPWTPGGCVSMSACAIAIAVPTSALVAAASSSPTNIVAARAAALPLGPTYAPELPPPRA